MARNTHQNRSKRTRARRRGQGQGDAVSRQPPSVSAAQPVGNAVPTPREEVVPQQLPALPEQRPALIEGQPAGQVSSRRFLSENDKNDRVEISVTKVGDQKIYAFDGIDRVSRALSRSILSCGLVIALIVVPIVCILAHNSMLEKVICGAGGAAVGALAWLASLVKRKFARWQHKRQGKKSSGDADHD